MTLITEIPLELFSERRRRIYEAWRQFKIASQHFCKNAKIGIQILTDMSAKRWKQPQRDTCIKHWVRRRHIVNNVECEGYVFNTQPD